MVAPQRLGRSLRWPGWRRRFARAFRPSRCPGCRASTSTTTAARPLRADHAPSGVLPDAHRGGILERVAGEVVAATRPVELCELGSGVGRKVRHPPRCRARPGHPSALRSCSTSTPRSSPSRSEASRATTPVFVFAAWSDDFQSDLAALGPGGGRLALLLAGTIGNLHPDREVPAFLRTVARQLAPGDTFLVGLDLVKDVSRLQAAYNDAAGVTAEFNRNILRVVNAALDADFDPEAYDHVAFYDRDRAWIEMRLRARHDQRVRVPGAGLTLTLRRGQEIRTELSCKYTRPTFEARLAGTAYAARILAERSRVVVRPGPVEADGVTAPLRPPGSARIGSSASWRIRRCSRAPSRCDSRSSSTSGISRPSPGITWDAAHSGCPHSLPILDALFEAGIDPPDDAEPPRQDDAAVVAAARSVLAYRDRVRSELRSVLGEPALAEVAADGSGTRADASRDAAVHAPAAPGRGQAASRRSRGFACETGGAHRCASACASPPARRIWAQAPVGSRGDNERPELRSWHGGLHDRLAARHATASSASSSRPGATPTRTSGRRTAGAG